MSWHTKWGDFPELYKEAPVYNFINGRLADKPTVLKPLS